MSLPPHPIAEAHGAPFPERMRLTCRNWAAGEHATPMGVIVFYWVKYALLYIGGWALFVGFSRGDTPFTAVGEWAFTADAFRKAVLWSLLYESLGFGGSFGPMNARLWPPMGGALYFLRPGSTKLPLFPGAPLIGADTRGGLDVVLYAAFMGACVWALVAPTVTPALLLPVVILTAALGVLDKTTFLAARSEHFFTSLLCLTVLGASEPWVAACQVVWLGIWLWAGVSKMNHHFPSVIMVMMNNGPFFPQALKRRLFRAFPDDLRPSGFAIGMARMGTLIELSIPALLVLSPSPEFTFGALCVMTVFHGYIALNNPSGMPIEWNIAMVYGGWFLFGVHPEASLAALLAHPALLAFLVVVMLAIPAYGNVVPSRVSFLLAMRYYAGNWAYTIWLFRGDSAAKLGKLKKAAGHAPRAAREAGARRERAPQDADDDARAPLAPPRGPAAARRAALRSPQPGRLRVDGRRGDRRGDHRVELRRRPPERRAAARERAASVRLRVRRAARRVHRGAAALRTHHGLAGPRRTRRAHRPG
jgi:hypothetical protein